MSQTATEKSNTIRIDTNLLQAIKKTLPKMVYDDEREFLESAGWNALAKFRRDKKHV